MQPENVSITGGVDTHKDTDTAAALDSTGRLLGTEIFPASAGGYKKLLNWLQTFGGVSQVGVEGTSSYGAGLTRFLAKAGIAVVEVNRPNRQTRRQKGKSDPVDAESAARAALSGQQLGVPKSQDGEVEILRMLRLQRRSAIKARSQAAN